MKKIQGFTLIELLIVIIILGILAMLLMGNFMTSLKKGRDARRKEDLTNIQKALEMYYEDKGKYPDTSELTFGTGQLKDPDSTKIYIVRLPSDPSSSSSYNYCVSTDEQKYQLYAALENSLDPQIMTPSYFGNCKNLLNFCGSGISKPCSYGISSPNISP